MRYWEDFHTGDVTVHGSATLSETEIIEFARRYDPQPLHTDPVAAARSPFGGLIASGWQLACTFASLFVRDALGDGTNVWSPGIEELRWLAPVRPGDSLTARSRITATWPSRSDPARGNLRGEYELVNQDGTVVMRFEGRGQVTRRAAAAATESKGGEGEH